MLSFYGLFLGTDDAQTLEIEWLCRPLLTAYPILVRSHHQTEELPILGRVVTKTYYDEWL